MILIVVFILLVAFCLSVPVAMALGIASLVGLFWISPQLLVVMPQTLLAAFNSFPLLAIPLFILAGNIMAKGGIARRIVELALVFVGRIPGGLGLVTIVSTIFFAGVCGSSSADTAAIGSVMLPAMRRNNYPPEFATAILAAAGGTAMLIPPSMDLIIIGVVANISIGGLFAAGVLPGAVNGMALLGMAYYYGRKLSFPLQPPMSLKEKLRICWTGIPAFLMPIIILGGILGGIFTPTEAASVAVVYGFCIAFFVYKELSLADLPSLFLKTSVLTGVVLLVIGMASTFSYLLTIEQLPQQIAESITRHSSSWVVFVLFVHLLFLALGMIMDSLPVLILLMPILAPAAVSLGMNPIHLGILVEANVGISHIAPPLGVSLYVACSISETPIESVVRYLWPFLIVLLGTLLIISYVPELTLFLPRALGYVHE